MDEGNSVTRRRHTGRVYCCLAGIAVLGLVLCPAHAETVQILEDFAADPGWEGINNRPAGEPSPVLSRFVSA